MSTHEIVPDGVDADTLRSRLYTGPPSDDEPEKRCPNCGYAKVMARVRSDIDGYCEHCQTAVTEAVYAHSIEAALRRGDTR